MKAYGLPRISEIAFPDVADITHHGLKSSVGHLRGKGGDIRSSFKNPEAKARTRRLFKRRARAEGKEACNEDVSS